MNTGVKIGIIVGAAVLVTVVVIVIVKSSKPPVNTGASAAASANPQINYLVAYNAPNAGNNWAMVLPTLAPADLATLYTYVSSMEAGKDNGTFPAASAIVAKYKLSAKGTYFD